MMFFLSLSRLGKGEKEARLANPSPPHLYKVGGASLILHLQTWWSPSFPAESALSCATVAGVPGASGGPSQLVLVAHLGG